MSESNAKTAKSGERRRGVGGRRLADAFEVVSRLPALAEARRRLVGACDRQASTPSDIADAIESDAALAIAAMRAANNGSGPPGRAAGIREAVEELGVERVRAIASGIEVYDVLEQAGASSARHERFRRHAVAVRSATDRIAEVARLGQRDELAIAALLHDVGRLVIAELYGDDYESFSAQATPDDRVRAERRELGIDHALVGAVLVRRWGVSGPIASAVERHHAPDASGH
ncbi:MAG TPA: HDOD domain-containing protein, partial [Solirubrobacterales bacterium]|nr:HDOD domain-containing protein [Solirubrobacterales bacterium]